MNKSFFTVGLLLTIALTACGNQAKETNQAANTTESGNAISAPQSNQPYPKTDAMAEAPVSNPTTLSWTNMEHDFGTVKKESASDYVFTFKNTGSNPLIINSAKGSCGCTVPEYPKEPVMPGAEGKIKVTFSAGTTEGPTEKTVTIDANTEPRTSLLKIRANVK